MTAHLKAWQGLAVLLVATILAYLPSLLNAFVYDDFDYVVENPILCDRAVDLKAVFTTAYPPNHPEQKLYRPLVTLSYVVDKAIWGIPSSPRSQANLFHLTNLLWHLAVVVALFVLARRLSGGAEAGTVTWSILLGTAFFALHPMTTESVAWVSGRAEVMAAFFCLVSIYALIRFRQTAGSSRSWLIPLWGGYAFALLCKENAIVLPVLAVLVQCRYPSDGKETGKRFRFALAGYGLVAAAYLGWRQYLFSGVQLQVQAYTGITDFPTRVLVASKVIARYLLMVLAPYRQSVFHEVHVEQVLGSIALGVLVVVSIWLIQKRRQFPNLSFGWFWFLIALLPVSNILFPIGAVMGERFIYLPLIGLALALASAMRSMAPRDLGFAIGLSAVLVHHGIKTAFRNTDWRNDRTLWASAEEVYPNSFIVQAQLGYACEHLSDTTAAQRHFSRALELLQNQPAAYRNTFETRIRSALQQLAQNQGAKPVSPELESINKVARENRFAEAATLYTEYIGRHPTDTVAQQSLADCYLGLRSFDQAAGLLQSLVASHPQDALLHAKLGFAYSHLGKTEQARAQYGTALELNPGDAITWANFASLEMREGNYEKAAQYLEHAVKEQPLANEYRLNLAVCLFQLGQKEQALKHARIILQHDPNHAEAKKLIEAIAKP